MNKIARTSGSPPATARPQKPSTRAVSVRPSSPAFASQVASLAISASVMGLIINRPEEKANARGPGACDCALRGVTVARPRGACSLSGAGAAPGAVFLDRQAYNLTGLKER